MLPGRTVKTRLVWSLVQDCLDQWTLSSEYVSVWRLLKLRVQQQHFTIWISDQLLNTVCCTIHVKSLVVAFYYATFSITFPPSTQLSINIFVYRSLLISRFLSSDLLWLSLLVDSVSSVAFPVIIWPTIEQISIASLFTCNFLRSIILHFFLL